MINEENKTEIIDQYLAGTLDPALRQQVEERMQSDADFRQEVALQEKIIKAVQAKERASLRNDLDAIFEETVGKEEATQEEPKVVSLSNRRIYYAIAAAVALVIVAGIFFFLNHQPSGQNFGYVAVKLSDGSRGELPATIPDSIPILILQRDPQYNFHYQFGDTLKLYGDFSLNDLTITYEPNKAVWELQFNGQTHPIPKTQTIKPITP